MSSDATALVSEYTTLVEECRVASSADEELNWDFLEYSLAKHADWTPSAAQALTTLARDYGAFMLRNALALAIALDIEDGELGF